VDIAAGVSAGYPVIGMSMYQLAQVLGEPNRVYFEDLGSGPRERRLYRRGIRTYIIEADKGKVVSIQHDAAGTQKAARNCPSDIEMRNMETTASSIGTSDARRREINRRLSELRAACR